MYLVIGGTGKVGTGVVSNLLAQAAPVTVLTKSEARRHLVPEGCRAAIGDLIANPRALRAEFDRADTVFMINKASPTEAIEGLIAVRLAKEAGVKRIVYQTAHLLDDLAYLPHLGAKFVIRKAIQLSGLDFTFIAPNHFFQNDEMASGSLVASNAYLTPLGLIGCDSIDARDVASLAAAVLMSTGHGGQTYNVVGAQRLTGPVAANIWSNELKREIRPGSIKEWSDYTAPYMPPWLHYDLSTMYEDFAKRGMCGKAEDVDQFEAIVGRRPRTYEAYVREVTKRIKT